MKTKVPNVVRKVSLGGKWIFAPVARQGERLDFQAVVVKGKRIPMGEGSFYLDYREGGRRRRRSVGDDPADVKRAIATQLHVLEVRRRGLSAEDAPELVRRAEGKPLEEIGRDYAAHRPVSLSLSTHKKYKLILAGFVRWAIAGGLTHAPMIDDAAIERWMRHLRAEGQGASTIVDKVVMVAAELGRHGAPLKLRKGDLPRVTHREREIYTREELVALFAACNPAEYVLFQTFLLTGMREQEVGFLADTDVDARRSVLRVTAKPGLGFTPKNYHERSVSVPRRLIEMIQTHLGERKGLIFATSDLWADRKHLGAAGGKRDGKMLQKLKRLARRAGLNCGRCHAVLNGKAVLCATAPVCARFGLHKFRHTYATSMLRDRMDIESLRRQLGHSDLASTRHYLHALSAEELQPEVETSSLASIR